MQLVRSVLLVRLELLPVLLADLGKPLQLRLRNSLVRLPLRLPFLSGALASSWAVEPVMVLV